MRRALAWLVLAACDRSGSAGAVLVEDEEPAAAEIRGVSPLDFRCASLTPLESTSTAVGVPLVLDASAPVTLAGVPPTCRYTSTDPAAPASWSYDLDCRPGALAAGEQSMVELASRAGSVPVLVGRSGIDAGDAGLLFIDDDAPCYVRIVGPPAPGRVALGRLIAERLERRTAPSRIVLP